MLNFSEFLKRYADDSAGSMIVHGKGADFEFHAEGTYTDPNKAVQTLITVAAILTVMGGLSSEKAIELLGRELLEARTRRDSRLN